MKSLKEQISDLNQEQRQELFKDLILNGVIESMDLIRFYLMYLELVKKRREKTEAELQSCLVSFLTKPFNESFVRAKSGFLLQNRYPEKFIEENCFKKSNKKDIEQAKKYLEE